MTDKELSEIAYTVNGEQTTFDTANHNYYRLDMEGLKKYVTIRSNPLNYALMNPAGQVFVLDPETNPALTGDSTKTAFYPTVDLEQYTNHVYVDINNGSDATGDGSKDNPYKTLKYAFSQETNSTAFIIANGTYNGLPDIPVGSGSAAVSNSGIKIPDDIAIVGNGKDVVIENLQFGPANNNQKVVISDVKIHSNTGDNFIYMGHYGSDSIINMTIYRSIFSGYHNRRWAEMHGTVKIYNSVIDLTDTGIAALYNGEGNSYTTSSFLLYNCLVSAPGSRGIVGVYTNCEATNSLFAAKNGGGNFATSSSNVQENTNLKDYTLDSTQPEFTWDSAYRITNYQELWQNTGTGTNPDGTQAHIGVYGGEYAWE